MADLCNGRFARMRQCMVNDNDFSFSRVLFLFFLTGFNILCFRRPSVFGSKTIVVCPTRPLWTGHTSLSGMVD